jgi:thioredoxin
MPVIAVTDQTFEDEVLRSERPVLVDLYADWCAPCKQLAPIVEQLSKEYEGKLKVAKVDVDKNPLVAQTFRVQSIPMLLLFSNGQIAGHQLGLVDKATLRKMIEPVLPSEAAEVRPQELAQMIARRRALPVDVRDAGSFGRYRIPTAVNVPADKVMERIEELRPRDGRVRVLYGRTTEDAKPLAEKIRERGVEVGFLSGGFLHWEADGLEVDRG